MKFSKGDVVVVKSGGPVLTVLDVDDDEVKVLFYSDEIGEFRTDRLPAFALQPYGDDEAEDEQDEDEDEEEDEDGKDKED